MDTDSDPDWQVLEDDSEPPKWCRSNWVRIRIWIHNTVSNCTWRLLSAWEPFFYIISPVWKKNSKKNAGEEVGVGGGRNGMKMKRMFYSCETKGLAMASIPSTGQINTTAVPLNNSHKLKSVSNPVGSRTFWPGRIRIRNNWSIRIWPFWQENLCNIANSKWSNFSQVTYIFP